MNRRKFLVASAAAATAPYTLGTAWADIYPSRPVKLIVPFAPGGSTDVIARVISEPLWKQIGQPVVVDNKAGAGGIVGTMELVRAAPDGYTILLSTRSVTGSEPRYQSEQPL